MDKFRQLSLNGKIWAKSKKLNIPLVGVDALKLQFYVMQGLWITHVMEYYDLHYAMWQDL